MAAEPRFRRDSAYLLNTLSLEHSKETDVKHRGIPVGSESAYTAGIRQTINEVSQMRSAKVEIKEV